MPPTPRPPKTASASGSSPTAAPTAQPSSTPLPPPWVERATRTEFTKGKPVCQVQPFTFSSTLAVEVRWTDPTHLALRVTQDDEKAEPIQPLPSLLGKGYTTDLTGQGLPAATPGGAFPDERHRLDALTAAFLGWPGAAVVARTLTPGTEVPELEAPVGAIADVPLHGAEEPPGKTTTHVKFAATRKGDVGDERVFDVDIQTTGSDAGMCHHWTHEASVKGELRLRASSGAMLGLHLEGTTDDSEGVCQGANGGKPPPDHPCNKGKVTVDVKMVNGG
jgi:hypothetical protein